ncbi:hypothetical protein ABT369_34070 [Dactylosporangium sp. NPDC000244]
MSARPNTARTVLGGAIAMPDAPSAQSSGVVPQWRSTSAAAW